jgi:hypothetical protein
MFGQLDQKNIVLRLPVVLSFAGLSAISEVGQIGHPTLVQSVIRAAKIWNGEMQRCNPSETRFLVVPMFGGESNKLAILTL